MSGKVPSRVRIARTQRNTPKYAGNMNREGLISCGFGRNRVMCQKIKSRTAAAVTPAANVPQTAKPKLVGAVGFAAEGSAHIILTFDMALFEPVNINTANFVVTNVTQAQEVTVSSLNGSGVDPAEATIRLNIDDTQVETDNDVNVRDKANTAPKITASSNNEEADPFTSNDFKIELP